MDKRQFLTVTALGTVTAASPASAARPAPSPALLTITGAIGRGNRGALDPALDQLMAKQGVRFDKGHAFDFAALAALPAVTIRPTLEYDGKPHVLRGPLLAEVLKAAGVQREQAALVMRAIDGYAPAVTLADIRKYRFIIATHLDDRPMPLGGLGPLWAVYDADRFPDMAARPLNARFGNCPWGLYHIEVQ
ncbi:molybdopterin-dependent oxidoreductase [Noviherbaspirillum denitrificans]|uniref:Molybdopterin-dependent oxidoreductase n=1 Tax=Noviherbaspirillum denitrificans TaxID=1968433 RepID=A0A254TGW3_9BURK|nr:molybdopterin-dependent oxidoreductase [Noviherbaspirillum denitrificans]OWW21901.1 molybdopterin-dependent oxidoreductase [Noviherbaspirillum denitrificans]